jgi:hypothetical protein
MKRPLTPPKKRRTTMPAMIDLALFEGGDPTKAGFNDKTCKAVDNVVNREVGGRLSRGQHVGRLRSACHTVSQGSLKWHRWRDACITASSAAALVGRSPYSKPQDLFNTKLTTVIQLIKGRDGLGFQKAMEQTRTAPDAGGAKMRLGHHCEQFILREAVIAGEASSVLYPPGLYFYYPYPGCLPMMASLDGLDVNVTKLHSILGAPTLTPALGPEEEQFEKEDAACFAPAVFLNPPHGGGAPESMHSEMMGLPDGEVTIGGPNHQRFIEDAATILECKVVNPSRFKGSPIEEHWWQLQFQMLVTGCPRGKLLYLVGTDLRYFEVKASPTAWDALLDAYRAFSILLAEAVNDTLTENGHPPITMYDSGVAEAILKRHFRGANPLGGDDFDNDGSAHIEPGGEVFGVMLQAALELQDSVAALNADLDVLKSDIKDHLIAVRNNLDQPGKSVALAADVGVAKLTHVNGSVKPDIERALFLACDGDPVMVKQKLDEAGTIVTKAHDALRLIPKKKEEES